VAGAQLTGAGSRHAYDLSQPTAHAVALHGVANLFRYSESDTDSTLVPARTRLQHERAAGRPHPVRRGPKIASAFQPLNDQDGTGVPITH
jgi:hypothetical protein